MDSPISFWANNMDGQGSWMTYCAIDNHCRAIFGPYKEPAAQSQAIKSFELDIFTLLLCGHVDLKFYQR